jgi:hypothetical protein
LFLERRHQCGRRNRRLQPRFGVLEVARSTAAAFFDFGDFRWQSQRIGLSAKRKDRRRTGIRASTAGAPAAIPAGAAQHQSQRDDRLTVGRERHNSQNARPGVAG